MERSGRVTFHFGEEFEVRYVTQLPARGRVFRHGGAFWILTSLEPDPVGGYAARLTSPRDVVRRTRVDAARMRRISEEQRELAARLLKGDADVLERATRLRALMSR